MSLDLPMKGPQPMALSRSGRSRRPPAGLKTTGYGGTNCRYGSLKSIKVSVRASLHNTSTIGATPTPQQNLLDKSIEQRPYKSVTPYSTSPTPRTRLRFRPSKVTATLNNLLDGNTQGKYHRKTCFRAFRPVTSKGGSSRKPPPFSHGQNIPIIPPARSTYSGNFNINQSMKCAFLHRYLPGRFRRNIPKKVL